MTQASNARNPKLHAGCVEVELRVEPPELAERVRWDEATASGHGAQIVLTDEGPWLRLSSFASWPVLVEVPTADGETLELRLGGVPQISPPPLAAPAPRILPPARPAPVEPEAAHRALAQLRTYMRSFSGARHAPEETRDAILRRVGDEMAKVLELVEHVPDDQRDELRALFDEITAAMPAARQLALEQA